MVVLREGARDELAQPNVVVDDQHALAWCLSLHPEHRLRPSDGRPARSLLWVARCSGRSSASPADGEP